MEQEWKEKWEQRYAEPDFAYGIKPNNYFKLRLDGLKPGKILFAAEGEGRNAVYAAQLGWQVSAFDISEHGKIKALQLARDKNVTIDYRLGNLDDLGFEPESFDAIALIYAHFPAEIKSGMHRKIATYLKSAGVVILEAFGKNHIEYLAKNEKVGGPKDEASLFSIAEIKEDFPNYEVEQLEETIIELNEGSYHNGQGSVIRFVGRKPQRVFYSNEKAA